MLYRTLLLIAPGLVCLACALDAGRLSDRQAAASGFTRVVVTGAGFQHVVYRNRRTQDSGVLHVYLEGDGSPWLGENRIARDPGPRNPLMLALMAEDPAPSLYLGRPCYHGLADDPACNPLMWTSGRYSQPVVASMVRALEKLTSGHDNQDLVLIGYSGGGTIAMLLAERVQQVRAVVTLAGNLNTDQWTALHDYSPLVTSLNPAQRAPLDPRIYQLHVAAEHDRVVPPALIAAAAARQVQAQVMIVPGIDHTCCWKTLWPELLEKLSQHVGPAQAVR